MGRESDKISVQGHHFLLFDVKKKLKYKTPFSVNYF